VSALVSMRFELADSLGPPHSDFMHAMEDEHCFKFGSQEKFEAVLNKEALTTCPCKEWKTVLEPSRELLRGRKRLDIQQLISHPISQAAALNFFEIIAIILYTGPMFSVYEMVLRQYPMNRYLDMKLGGNLFSTTIHVLASGIKKLASHTPKPELLFRGIRDLNSLHSCFVQPGYLERGFLSSTTSLDVAKSYAGGKQFPGCRKPSRPALIKIFSKRPQDLQQVCAEVGFLSQSFKDEVEFLFLPWTLLELKSGPKQDGLLTIIEVYAQSLLHVLTTEEIEKVDILYA